MTYSEHEQLTPMAELHLSSEEKTSMRNMLRAHAAINRPRNAVFAFVLRHGIASSLAGLLLFAGTSTVLAHRAIPGDLFYPIKLAVNDRIALAVAGNAEAKLDTELAQLDRILLEEERAADELFEDELDMQERNDDDEQKQEEYEGDDEWEDEHEDEQEDDEREDRQERSEVRSNNQTSSNDGWSAEIEAEFRALERDLQSAEKDEVPEEE